RIACANNLKLAVCHRSGAEGDQALKPRHGFLLPACPPLPMFHVELYMGLLLSPVATLSYTIRWTPSGLATLRRFTEALRGIDTLRRSVVQATLPTGWCLRRMLPR